MTARIRHIGALGLGAALALVSSRAAAWVETHVVGDEVRVEVDPSGGAVIDHAITMQIKGGPVRAFDIPGADRDAEPLADGTVIAARPDGLLNPPIPLDVSLRPDGALRVNVEHPKGVSRGAYLFHVRYRTSLLRSGGISRDGAMVRLRWTGPSWAEGIDAARCTFALTPAPTEPRIANGGVTDDPSPGGERRSSFESGAAAEDADDGTGESNEGGAFLAEVHRRPGADEIELTRPHVARGEAVAWTIRVDPKSLAGITDTRIVPRPAAAPAGSGWSRERSLYLAAGLLALLTFSLLVGYKAREVARHAHRAGVRPRPLLPIGAGARTALAGPAFAGGALLQALLPSPYTGTFFVLAAMLLATYRHPHYRPKPRGPGRWLPLSDEDGFVSAARPSGTWLDACAGGGRWVFLGTVLAATALAYGIGRVSAYQGWLVAFDLSALLPVFFTGRIGHLPPDPVRDAAPRLLHLATALRRDKTLRAVAWARLPDGTAEFDELRLLLTPRLPRRGFSGIEVGFSFASGAGGFVALPQVLVRVVDGSPCHSAFSALLPGRRWVRGRKPDERVAVVAPRVPTHAMTLALAKRLTAHAREDQPSGSGSRSAASSRGRSERTSNAGTVLSPAHPMNAA